MLTSVAWLNRYLTPTGLGADEVAAALERAGFPIEGREDRPGGDVVLDVELTSNRGDCLSHVGLAREVAAQTGRSLTMPVIPFDPQIGPGADATVGDVTDVDNQTPDVCPRFTARVIRGAKVGPSPDWLRESLEAIGQRSINNVVDVSNYVLFELGQPTHTFDLNTLAGPKIIVRWAKEKESFLALDGSKHTLKSNELVVADAERAVSLAGVIGGEETSVTEKTTDVLLEAATWDPATIRRAARRLKISTDAGHRFERTVDPRTIDFAAARCAALILDVAGGQLLEGVIDKGQERRSKTIIELRPRRCDQLLGIVIPPSEIVDHLKALDIEASMDERGELIRCEGPAHRPDLTREIDLIEEIARVHGFDHIPIEEKMAVEIKPLQTRERAMRALGGALTGMGFFETVTFSFVQQSEADLFMPPGMTSLRVDEERRKGEPALRPSVIPSLLRCRKVNQDGNVHREGGVRLFETASVYAETDDGRTVENRNLALLIDAPDAQEAWRMMRGVIDSCARVMGGAEASIEVEAAPPVFKACKADAHALIRLNGQHLGYAALLSDEAVAHYDLATPAIIAEVNLPALLDLYPPKANVQPLPVYPAIERDLSVVVDEHTPWNDIESTVTATRPALLEGVSFVGVYRGKQVGAGKKSVTFRMRFQDPDRTLRHEEVDPQIESVVKALSGSVNATLRA